MPGISLEDLRAIRDTQLSEIKKTAPYKKAEAYKKEANIQRIKCSMHLGKCQIYKNTWILHYVGFCSTQDCDEFAECQESMPKTMNELAYANSRLQQAQPAFAELEKCILEREYNELSVEQD